jgi:hypothetical protein
MHARVFIGLLFCSVVSIGLVSGCSGTSAPPEAVSQDETDPAMAAASADPSKNVDAANDPSMATEIAPKKADAP